jgi:parvulin-like peptidyl-prolyl isomerase
VSSFGAVKRALAAATAVVAVLALSSCDAVGDTETAATVGSSEVSVDQLQGVIEALGNSEQGAIDPVTNTIGGDSARLYLTALIQTEANEQFLAEHGEQITDEDRQAALATLTLPDGLPDDVVQLIADSQATTTVQQRIPALAADEVAARYAESPAALGMVCVRQVVLPTKAAADEVIDDLADGATIADLVDRSTDEASKANGGAVQGDDGAPCLVTPLAAQSLGSEVVLALADAKPGDIVGPVQGAAGWHVLEVRPYEEVSDAANALVQQYGGQLLFVGFLSGTDVSVDPRYGRWDAAVGSVIAL